MPTLANATLANHTQLQMCLDIKHFSKDILLRILFTHKNPLRPNFIDEHDISENLSFTILLIYFTVNLTAPPKGCARGICHNAATPTVGAPRFTSFWRPYRRRETFSYILNH